MGIVSQYTRTDGTISGFTPGFSGQLESTRQKVPYVSGPYDTHKMWIEKPPDSQEDTVKPYVYNALYFDDMSPAHLEQEAVQLARSRLNNSLIKGRAALGITAATANQSFGMIAQRSSQIYKAYKAARKGNVKAVARALNVNLSRKQQDRIAKTAQDAPGLWLEFTFGWSPLVSDMYAAAQVLSDPFEVKRSYGTCTLEKFYSRKGLSSDVYLSKKVRAVCTAGLRVDNPNVALLTQLGLSNPAAVVWDIIPFSFVIDWFFKINRFVNTWNDMAGFSYVDPVTTKTIRVNGLLDYHWWVTNAYYLNAGNGRRRVRANDIINNPVWPTFQLPTPNLWLAVTSTALCLQIFRKS